jgi:hypothetical protein
MADIEQAAAMLTSHLGDVPATHRTMNIVSSWADGVEGEPKILVREIHVAFRSPHEGKAVPSEFMGHVVKKVRWQS